MKDDSTEFSARRRYFRYAVFSLTALLVMSLGVALIPHQPPAPAETPFSERARAAALADTLALRAAGQELAGAATGDGGPNGTAGLDRVVTLLTIQARAMVLPGHPTVSERTEAGQTAAPDASEDTAAAPGSLATPALSSITELATALSSSGARRLTDALEADGGMARLLAGAGAAQLLAAGDLAALAGVPADELPGWKQPTGTTAKATPAPAECASAGPSGEADGESDNGVTGASLGAALTAALDAELEAIYGYQAALTRLDPAAAAKASGLLAEHLDLADETEAYAATQCAAIPPAPPGYVLDAAFLGAPTAGLERLESGTLTAFGDVVALSAAPTRAWAVSALVAAARRTVGWGGEPGAVPGLALDESLLPALPEMPEDAVSTAPGAAT